MTDARNKAECLDRARMHEQLASSTDDGPARMIHQAMAAEYRRRAGEQAREDLPVPEQRPVLEIVATA